MLKRDIDQLNIVRLSGRNILPYVNEIACLRKEFYKEYPYLYNTTMDFEIKDITHYASYPESTAIIVFDKDVVVGASTGIPMIYEEDVIQQSFMANNISPDTVFYLADSILRPEYRGLGLYRSFFSHREKVAESLDLRYCSFCCVKRASDDHKRPPKYTPLDSIWQHFDYSKHAGLDIVYAWEETDGKKHNNILSFWLKQTLSPNCFSISNNKKPRRN